MATYENESEGKLSDTFLQKDDTGFILKDDGGKIILEDDPSYTNESDT